MRQTVNIYRHISRIEDVSCIPYYEQFYETTKSIWKKRLVSFKQNREKTDDLGIVLHLVDRVV